jgi:hypothetical protein
MVAQPHGHVTGRFRIQFGLHVPADRVAGMVSGIAAYGNITAEADRKYSVEVLRASRLPSLRKRLVNWDRYGFLTWEEISN